MNEVKFFFIKSNNIRIIRMGKDTVFSGKMELYLQMMWQKGRNVGFIEKKREKKRYKIQ